MKAAKSLAKAAPKSVKKAVCSSADLSELMPLVYQVVGRFLKRLPPNVLRDDLVAAGTFGLIDALRKGGEERGATFEWYARVRIRGAILDELRNQDWLTRRARSKMSASMQPDAALGFRAAVIGFDDLPIEVQTRGLADENALTPMAQVEERMEKALLARAVEELPERERFIVQSHYFQSIPFKSIAATLGVSEPRVSQLHSRAMQRLKGVLERAAKEEAA